MFSLLLGLSFSITWHSRKATRLSTGTDHEEGLNQSRKIRITAAKKRHRTIASFIFILAFWGHSNSTQQMFYFQSKHLKHYFCSSVQMPSDSDVHLARDLWLFRYPFHGGWEWGGFKLSTILSVPLSASSVVIWVHISPLARGENPGLRVRNLGLVSALKSYRSRGNLLPVLNPTSPLQKIDG